MYCKKCGSEIEDNSNYCSKCGFSVETRKFYRSGEDIKFLGICGGLGEYFHIDSNIIRLIIAILILSTTIIPGLLIYFIAGFFIPYKSD